MKVDKRGLDDCWTWMASRFSNGGGYGQFSIGGAGGSAIGAHRYSWDLHFGPIPEGMLVCHHCDNPPCVNPAHLFLGTHVDNALDMVAKGRSPKWAPGRVPISGDKHYARVDPSRMARGEASSQAKVTEADVREMRMLHASGSTYAALARKYGVTYQAIAYIVRREHWAHVP